MSRGRRPQQRLVAFCVTATMLVAMLFATIAYAENPSSAQSAQLADQLVQDIEQATITYQDATAAVDNLADQIAQNESHASEIEQALPAQRELAAKSIKQLYLLQQSSPDILGLIFSADDFNEFITALEYVDAIHDHNTTQVTALQSMHNDLAQTRATLTMEFDAAKQKQSEALRALDTIRTSLATLQQQAASTTTSDATDDAQQQPASSALQEAQEIVSTLPEPVAQAVRTPSEPEAQVQESKPEDNKTEEKDAEQKPAESEGEAPAEQKPADPEPQAPAEQEPAPAEPQTPVVEAPVVPIEGQNTNTEVDSWAARIDAYLSSYGAPLAGHGATFAQAAAEYGVDPRISPAISIIESGGGKVCFLPHNCWGWGTASWPDWDSAIRGHISGFASIYGSTLTREGAVAYASMDEWEMWYNLLQAEMASI